MKNIINVLIKELQKEEYQNGFDVSENFEQFYKDSARFLIDKATKGKRIKVTANCIYTGLILPIKHVYFLPTTVLGDTSFRVDLTGTHIASERGYSDTVIWESNFEWIDDVAEYNKIKAAL